MRPPSIEYQLQDKQSQRCPDGTAIPASLPYQERCDSHQHIQQCPHGTEYPGWRVERWFDQGGVLFLDTAGGGDTGQAAYQEWRSDRDQELECHGPIRMSHQGSYCLGWVLRSRTGRISSPVQGLDLAPGGLLHRDHPGHQTSQIQ